MAAQVSVNLTAAITPSRTIDFFRRVPRWPTASKNFEFDISYVVNNALTGLIPFFVGLALTLLFIVHIIIRYTCRERSTDNRQAALQQSKLATAIQILISTILIALVIIFISMGLIGNATLSFSARDAIDIIGGVMRDLLRVGYAMIDTADYIRKRLVNFDPRILNRTAISDEIGDIIEPTLKSMRTYALNAYPDFRPLQESLGDLVESINDVLDVIRKVVTIVYAVILVILVLLASAPVLLFVAEILPKRARCARIFAQIVYLLLPALLAWVLFGVSSVVGALVSDVCVSLHEYRSFLMGNRSTSGNALVDSGFVCPEGLSSSDLDSRIGDTTRGILQSNLTQNTVELVLNSSANNLISATNWTAQEISRVLNCTVQVEFSGRLEFAVCGSEGQSSMEGIFGLWVGFLGLAVVLTLALFMSLFGLQVARSLYVRSGEVRLQKPAED